MNKTKKFMLSCIIFSILGVFFVISSIVQFMNSNLLSAILDFIAGILFIAGAIYEVYKIRKASL